MRYEGLAISGEINTVFDHPWPVLDQETAFSAIAYVASTDSVSSVCGPWLQTQPCSAVDLRNGIKVQGPEITALLLNQSLEYFQKGLYNFFAQYLLARRGLKTWAIITNYYASFFSVHALLCLQGRTITRIDFGSKVRCHVLPFNLTTHEFIFCEKGIKVKGGEHAAPWVRYYTVYDHYTHPIPAFDVVYKRAYISEPIDESDQRNLLNYVPFVGFSEMINQDEIEEFTKIYLAALSTPPVGQPLNDYLTVLQALATDPDIKYFARVALRLLFIADVLQRLVAVNNSFRAEWMRRLPLWRTFALIAFSDPPQNFFESLPQLLQ